MRLRDVKQLVESLNRLPDDVLLGKRASNLTVGDLRMLLRCAVLMDADCLEPYRATQYDPSVATRAD